MNTIDSMKKAYDLIKPFLNEKQRRGLLGAMSLSVERGGVNRFVEAGMGDPRTIARGRKEVMAGPPHYPARTKTGNIRVRIPGGGRKRLEELDKSELAARPGYFGANGGASKGSESTTGKPENSGEKQGESMGSKGESGKPENSGKKQGEPRAGVPPQAPEIKLGRAVPGIYGLVKVVDVHKMVL